MIRLGRAVLTAGFVGALALTAGCPEEKPEEPKPEEPEEPKKPEIPEYNPTGDHADLKKASAADITADNAVDMAKALDKELDAAIEKQKAAEGGETEEE